MANEQKRDNAAEKQCKSAVVSLGLVLHQDRLMMEAGEQPERHKVAMQLKMEDLVAPVWTKEGRAIFPGSVQSQGESCKQKTSYELVQCDRAHAVCEQALVKTMEPVLLFLFALTGGSMVVLGQCKLCTLRSVHRAVAH